MLLLLLMMMMMMMMLTYDTGTKLTEYKVDEDAIASIAMEVGVAKREAEIVCCSSSEL